MREYKPRRGLGYAEPMPYTGGGRAAPLEPAQGGRGVMFGMQGGPANEEGRQYGPTNRSRQANKYDREGVDGPPYPPADRQDQERRDYDDWENSTADGHIDDFEAAYEDWMQVTGDGHEPEKTAQWAAKWRRILKSRGYSDEEIEKFMAEVGG